MSTQTAETIEITDSGLFGGVFALVDAEASGFGVTRYELECDVLDCIERVDFEICESVIRAETDAESEDDIEAMHSAICADDATDNVAHLLLVEQEQCYLSWELQRLRGCIARAAGYSAVECEDENGGVVLVLEGTLVRA